MKKIGIFIDDERTPCQVTWVPELENFDWLVVRTNTEFFKTLVELIQNGIVVHALSFDHDLQLYINGKEVTGYDILKQTLALCEAWCVGIPEEIFFHTKNPVGKRNMEEYLRAFREACTSGYFIG